jgi:hypothetical protein
MVPRSVNSGGVFHDRYLKAESKATTTWQLRSYSEDDDSWLTGGKKSGCAKDGQEGYDLRAVRAARVPTMNS